MRNRKSKDKKKAFFIIIPAVILIVIALLVYNFMFSHKKLSDFLAVKPNNFTSFSIVKVEGILDMTYVDISDEKTINELVKFINGLDVKALTENTDGLLFNGAEYYSLKLEEGNISFTIDFFADNYIIITENTAILYKSTGRTNVLDKLDEILK